MLKELGDIGVVLTGVSPDSRDKSKVIYNATLPFKFEIVDDEEEIYTHFKVAQKVKKKNIIKYRRKVGPMVLGDSNSEDFTLCYIMRDDVWTKERRDNYSILIKEEIDNIVKVLEELEKKNKAEEQKD